MEYLEVHNSKEVVEEVLDAVGNEEEVHRLVVPQGMAGT